VLSDELRDVAGQPGLFRTEDGHILNFRDFVPFETSERFEGVNWALDTTSAYYVLTGWRFTCAVWPKDLVEVQQAVLLKIEGRTRALWSLSSLLTLPGGTLSAMFLLKISDGFGSRERLLFMFCLSVRSKVQDCAFICEGSTEA